MDVNLTSISVAVVSGVFSILGVLVTALVNKYIKDTTAASTLNTALQNALGKIQQAAVSSVQTGNVTIHNVPIPANLAPGVQYVLDHAGEEAAHFGITPDKIADKIEARIGVKHIETNIAVSGSDQSTVVAPLGPVPTTDPPPAPPKL